jgi:energy-coupling factor transporter ATP-binding protein EcfA2
MPRLEVRDLGPIREASVELADLTILVGPQASGKSIFLQTLKLALDHESIGSRLRQQGLGWYGRAPTLLDLYFGEGMRAIWGSHTSVGWIANGKRNEIEPARLAYETERDPRDRFPRDPMVFYVPAHRALTLKNGWPRHFGDYSAGDPFVVREFSEMLRLLLEYTKPNGAVSLRRSGVGETTRSMVQEGVFGEYELRLDRTSPQKRLVLQRGKQPPLPFMVWSAGQREFGPLSIGLNYLFPRTKGRLCDWVILEEPEMGLHPKAITAVLLLVLELLSRGYRVCLSTHSPHILDLIWALRVFREKGAGPSQVLELFGMKKNVGSKRLAAEVLRKSVHAYYFDRQIGEVVDISRLDPSSDRAPETSWGGLIEWSTRVSNVVADFVANS